LKRCRFPTLYRPAANLQVARQLATREMPIEQSFLAMIAFSKQSTPIRADTSLV
jgi:hypothetical protein